MWKPTPRFNPSAKLGSTFFGIQSYCSFHFTEIWTSTSFCFFFIIFFFLLHWWKGARYGSVNSCPLDGASLQDCKTHRIASSRSQMTPILLLPQEKTDWLRVYVHQNDCTSTPGDKDHKQAPAPPDNPALLPYVCVSVRMRWTQTHDCVSLHVFPPRGRNGKRCVCFCDVMLWFKWALWVIVGANVARCIVVKGEFMTLWAW